MDTADAERLCERDAADSESDSAAADDTDDDDAVLEPDAEPELEPVPDASRDDSDVHSQNCRGGERKRSQFGQRKPKLSQSGSASRCVENDFLL